MSSSSYIGQAPTQRLGTRYRFEDADMDLFFVVALGWGSAGGLEVGQAFYVASRITDGDADSWVKEFSDYGDQLAAQADAWQARGWTRAAGEMYLKASASYRSAWHFAPLGETIRELNTRHTATFAAAMNGLGLPATFFEVPYGGGLLPGLFLRHPDPEAPVVLLIGGADTAYLDLFFSAGRNLFDRGFSVALVDLPGQGFVAEQGLYWEAESEKPIGAVVDKLVEDFGAVPGRIALLGLSLGGYFVTRAAGYEKRFGAVIASTPFPRPHEMFQASVKAGIAEHGARPMSTATRNNRAMMFWKTGSKDFNEFLQHTAGMVADPARVTVPFLSVVGGGESAFFMRQAHEWHEAIPSTRKLLLQLDAATGADGHCQVNNRLRLAQEVTGWLGEVFGNPPQA